MKSNRLALLGLQGFASLGSAVVGIFFPFLLGEAFGLNFTQILLWGAGFQLSLAIGAEPINVWLSAWLCPKQKILLGVSLLAGFYGLLGFGALSFFWFGVGSLMFVLYMILYWPNFHAAIFWSTQTGGRGSFLGSIQGLLIGVNMVAPVISGWFLDHHLGHWVSVVSVVFFVVALVFGRRVALPQPKEVPTGRLYQPLPKKNLLRAFFCDGLQTGVMWLIWPIFLRLLGLSFVQIGSIMAMAALVEIFASKVFGSLSDKICAQKLLQRYGIWARLVDLASRSILFFLAQPWTLAVIGGVSGVLGPIFQMPMYMRMHQHVASTGDFTNITRFFAVRERILGIARFTVLLLAAGLYHGFGLPMLPIFFVLAGVSALGFRGF